MSTEKTDVGIFRYCSKTACDVHSSARAVAQCCDTPKGLPYTKIRHEAELVKRMTDRIADICAFDEDLTDENAPGPFIGFLPLDKLAEPGHEFGMNPHIGSKNSFKQEFAKCGSGCWIVHKEIEPVFAQDMEE